MPVVPRGEREPPAVVGRLDAMRGRSTRRRAKAGLPPRLFLNQASAVVLPGAARGAPPGERRPVSVKLFRNGRVQLAGALSLEHGMAALAALVAAIPAEAAEPGAAAPELRVGLISGNTRVVARGGAPARVDREAAARAASRLGVEATLTEWYSPCASASTGAAARPPPKQTGVCPEEPARPRAPASARAPAARASPPACSGPAASPSPERGRGR